MGPLYDVCVIQGREYYMGISMGFDDPIITTYGPTLCSKMMMA